MLRLVPSDRYEHKGQCVPFLFIATGVVKRLAKYGITVIRQAVSAFWGGLSGGGDAMVVRCLNSSVGNNNFLFLLSLQGTD